VGIARSFITFSVSCVSSFKVGLGPRIGSISKSSGHRTGIDHITASRTA
jgi:hypothetical protein